MGMKWKDIGRSASSVFFYGLLKTIQTVEPDRLLDITNGLAMMEFHWKQNEEIVEELFITAVRLLSTERTALQLRFLMPESRTHLYETLDQSLALINQKMLSTIITK
jgi:hypothetical protein